MCNRVEILAVRRLIEGSAVPGIIGFRVETNTHPQSPDPQFIATLLTKQSMLFQIGLGVLSLVLLQRGIDQTIHHGMWSNLNLDALAKSAIETVKNWPTYSIAPNGTTIEGADFSGVFVIRTPSGLPNILNYQFGVPSIIFWAHTLGTITWAVFAPVQLVARIRKDYPTLHHLSGYLVASSAVALSISGLLFYPLSNKEKLGGGMFDLSRDLVLGNLIVLGSAVTLLTSLYKSVTLARQHKYAEHRRWAIRHLGVGYGFAIVRLFNVAGVAFSALAKQVFPGLLPAIENGGEKGFAMDKLIFGGSWVAGVGLGIYIAETILRREQQGKGKDQDKDL